MKNLHVHIRVEDLAQSRQFYTTLFGQEPTVDKSDYAKWQLDDPRVNFAISEVASNPGIDHIGIQAETGEELSELSTRLHSAGVQTSPQESANCCYAVSDKHWIQDPSGIKWETFYTHGTITEYGTDLWPESTAPPTASTGSCC